uniref:Transcription elongation regulator 1 n=3 Tax=Amphimedon queenslandica TaxID=400682 RepID=A0A1X7VJW6_AMPQE
MANFSSTQENDLPLTLPTSGPPGGKFQPVPPLPAMSFGAPPPMPAPRPPAAGVTLQSLLSPDSSNQIPNQSPLLVSPPLAPPLLPGMDPRPLLLPPFPGNPPPHVVMPTNPGLLMRPEIPFKAPPTEEDGPIWMEHSTSDGSVYYFEPTTKKTMWERPAGARIVPFNKPEPGPGAPPPLPLGVPLIPQRVWSEHKSPDDDTRTYYYNKVTRQSSWEKPTDFELVMPLPANLDVLRSSEAMPTSSETPPTSLVPANADVIDQSIGDEDNLKPVLVPQSSFDPPTVSTGLPPSNHLLPPSSSSFLPGNSDSTKPDQTEPMEMNEKELLAIVAAKLGTGPSPPTLPPSLPVKMAPNPKIEERKGPHPIDSVPVAGTPWSVVFTSDRKQFFFDATSRKSYWKLPPELIHNPLVLKILEAPPWKKQRVGELEEPATKKMKLAALVGEDEDSAEEEKGGHLFPPDPVKMEGIEVDLSAAVKAEVAERAKEMKAAEMRARVSLEERTEIFKAMLLEREVSAFSTWEKELPKFVFDERYQLLLAKERKAAFDEFVAARVEAELKERKSKAKEKRDTFMTFLREDCKITAKSTFTEFIRQYARCEKFKVIEKMKERESLFNEHLNELKKANKQRNEEQKQTQKTKEEKEKNDFLAMLKEDHSLSDKSQWKKVKSSFHKDRRYKAIESSSRREELFNEYIKCLNRDEKQELIAASLREREREVQLSRSAQEKQWDIEREQLRRTEAQQHFSSLLVDLIKDPLSSWTESKRQLRKDQRWELSELIDLAEKEKLFREHVSQLAKKRRLQFRKLLEETTKITLTMPWKKARKYIKEDYRYKNYSDSDHDREDEYERFLHDKMKQAKDDFRSLLSETKMITFKSKEVIESSDRHLKDIIETLKNDQRYLILDCIEEERTTILYHYIDELHSRGPPPPPTATFPSERLRK